MIRRLVACFATLWTVVSVRNAVFPPQASSTPDLSDLRIQTVRPRGVFDARLADTSYFQAAAVAR